MTVIPVGACLPDWEFVNEGRARCDAGEADPGNAVHVGWHQQAVPVDRAALVKFVDDGEADHRALLQPEQRRRNGAVDPNCVAAPPIDDHFLTSDDEPDIGSA
jgi:hypothetical protein